jgi:hypothetical protein
VEGMERKAGERIKRKHKEDIKEINFQRKVENEHLRWKET